MKRIMMEEKTRLMELIKELETSLKDAPEGTFFVSRNRRYTKWYFYKNSGSVPR